MTMRIPLLFLVNESHALLYQVSIMTLSFNTYLVALHGIGIATTVNTAKRLL